MPDANTAALDFLLTRRSRPAKTLIRPVPTREELRPILTAAARTPDHGKLEPWRFIVLENAALDRLADVAAARAAILSLDADVAAKARRQFADAALAVAVISAPKPSDKVPQSEQFLSAGAVCLALLNAALASGWGANWLTGWAASDDVFCRDGLNLSTDETVAGFIHIGTGRTAPSDRPRPDLDTLTTWVSA